MSAPTRLPQRKPIGTCPVCGDPVLSIEGETVKIDVPPISPDSPPNTTAIPGPSHRVYWPCGHREDL
ncbi:hypothetical protein [Nocardioides soli]|uniref:Uncharacterized protein with PIN domain n=1 Tax=Nocardioides soli TaxID=1036020 RepID=A0A7W4VT75_9ACTN|nr:hypothetical protein [Nocardioides soli]MBB3041205.1 uncharacterized protein with PIN domain [Nocardioides soli]